MLGDPRKNFIFLCVPKCASTSIEAALQPHCKFRFVGSPKLKHITARALHKHIIPLWPKPNPDIVCVIRHPLAWLESNYKYTAREHLATHAPAKYTGDVTFERYANTYLKHKEIRNIFIPFRTQTYFISKPGDTLGVKYIFSIDRLDIFTQWITDKLQLKQPLQLKHKNKSEADIDVTPLTSNTEQRVLDHMASDLELYNSVMANDGIYEVTQCTYKQSHG